MYQDPDASPFNALPPVVLALALAMFGVEAAITLGARGFLGGADAVGWRLAAIRDYGFSGPELQAAIDAGRFGLSDAARFVTYSFVHGSFIHMIFAVVFLLAIGKLVGEVFGGWAFLAIFFGSAIFGALIYGGLAGTRVMLIGGFPGVYGLIGAYTFLMWVGLRSTGENEAQAFTLIAFLLGIQLLFGLLFGGGRDWIADASGFVAGFALSFVVSPGGWARFLSRIRRR
ncbi:MAG: rhomboid family intramembrane serine protease [Pseudomonadota bacterium]